MLTKTCCHCGKSFSKGQNVSLREWNDQSKFCSRACYWAHKRTLPSSDELRALYESGLSCRAIAKQYNVHEQSVREQLLKHGVTFREPSDYEKPQCQPRSFGTCERCGKQFDKAFKRGGTGKPKRFCSLTCKLGWFRGNRVYNYVGESERKDAYPYDYSEWMKISDEIRKRDKVCRHCGKTPAANGRALDVHHIVPYRISRDNSHTNLVALCRTCHKKAESQIK